MDSLQAQILSEIGSDCQYQNSELCPVSNQKLTSSSFKVELAVEKFGLKMTQAHISENKFI
jgi:hypothetical protein